jgi:hypothetical protein
MLADEHECGYSDIELYGALEDRTCYLCGHINHTDKVGRLSKHCQAPKCRMLWEYWCLSPFPRPCQALSFKRRSYLGARIVSIFGLGSRKLYDIPQALLFDFLLSAMIERMAHEQNH